MTTLATITVSLPFLALVRALQHARDLYQSETALAGELKLQEPIFHLSRVERLFRDDYAVAREALGIDGDHRICAALLSIDVPAHLTQMAPGELHRHHYAIVVDAPIAHSASPGIPRALLA